MGGASPGRGRDDLELPGARFPDRGLGGSSRSDDASEE